MHNEATRFAGQGYTIFLIGHAGHEEVVGTMGEAPDEIVLVQTLEDVARLPDPRHREARVHHADDALGRRDDRDHRRPAARASRRIIGPPKDDICYATTNRQAAVKSLAREVDLVLVIGSANSSNSQRLVDVTRDLGVPAHLIDDESQILDSWLDGAETVGITSGASAPEWLVERVVDWFRERGVEHVAEHHLIEENVHFALPRGVRSAGRRRRARDGLPRTALAAAAASSCGRASRQRARRAAGRPGRSPARRARRAPSAARCASALTLPPRTMHGTPASRHAASTPATVLPRALWRSTEPSAVRQSAAPASMPRSPTSSITASQPERASAPSA